MERFTGKDGREWVRMPAADYWQRITEASSDVAAEAKGWNDALDAAERAIADAQPAYKVPGDADTYTAYSEGESDRSDIDQRIVAGLARLVHGIAVSGHASACPCAGLWKPCRAPCAHCICGYDDLAYPAIRPVEET